MVKKTDWYRTIGWIFIIFGALIAVYSLFSLMKQANPTTLEKAIEVYELKNLLITSVSAIIVGRLILGLADVIEQNNHAAFQFEEINRKLDIMMGKNNDDATESVVVDDASADYESPSGETDVSPSGEIDAPNKKTDKWELYVILGVTVFMVVLVIFLIVKGLLVKG